jgi:hypothetical protein
MPACTAEMSVSAMDRWQESLAKCSEHSASGLYFVGVFGGHWPVPDNFVLQSMESVRRQFNVTLLPPNGSVELSTIFIGSRDDYSKEWKSDLGRAKKLETLQLGGFEVIDGQMPPSQSARPPSRFTIMLRDDSYVMLWGPVSEHWRAFVDCYGKTSSSERVVRP